MFENVTGISQRLLYIESAHQRRVQFNGNVGGQCGRSPVHLRCLRSVVAEQCDEWIDHCVYTQYIDTSIGVHFVCLGTGSGRQHPYIAPSPRSPSPCPCLLLFLAASVSLAASVACSMPRPALPAACSFLAACPYRATRLAEPSFGREAPPLSSRAHLSPAAGGAHA